MTALACYDVQVYALSDVGRVRQTNEDSFFVADLTHGTLIGRSGRLRFRSGPQGALFAVADGMGGAAAGEMASRLGLRVLYEEVQELSPGLRGADDETLQEILIDSMGEANCRVFEAANHNSEYAGMGTTLTAVLQVGSQIVVGQVGDSRAYLLREDGIRQLTRDQSLVAHKVSIGELTEEQARIHPERNILLQALGVRPSVEVALRSMPLESGDVLLLSSDGLHGLLRSNEIFEIITESASPEAACSELIALANSRGGPDNITAVLVQFLRP